MATDENSASSLVQDAFAQFLLRRDAGDDISLSDLCKAFPDLEAELRLLHEHWQKMAAVLQNHAGLPAFTTWLEGRRENGHAAGATPTEEPGNGAASLSHELLDRLARHRPMHSRYQIKEEIARGGMGAILKVWDPDLRRHLAMKIILAKEKSSSAKVEVEQRALLRFLEEAQVASQLDHPGIVPVHELGLDSNGQVYFTMPLVKGSDLKHIFALMKAGKEGWTQTKVLRVIIKVCEAMAYAHSKRVIHRDLKPANIMVGRFGETYVMDWGLARILGRADVHDLRVRPDTDSNITVIASERKERKDRTPDSPLFTMDGDALGTPSYMSPEQALGFVDQLGPRSDVYSVGAMLYHLFAGRMPYVPSGSNLSPRTVLAMVAQGPPAPLATVSPGTPAELIAICDKAIARDPANRYGDTMEIARDLEAYLSSRPITAVPPKIGYVIKLALQRNKAVAITTASALAIVIALVAFFIVNLKDEVRKTNLALQNNGRLLDIKSAPLLVQEYDELYPWVPTTVPRMDSWLAKTNELLRRLNTHERDLASIPEANSAPRQELSLLVSQLKTLKGMIPLVDSHRAIAQNLKETTIDGQEDLWNEAIDDMAHLEAYAGIDVVPQLGLVPIHKDPHSGLWEFWHVLSGELPLVDPATGEVRLDERSGIVLVLLPGGAFMMGSRSDDPDRIFNEQLHKVVLTPFFISKYETTQAQWERTEGNNPSGRKAGTVDRGTTFTALHPVEAVTWFDCARFVAHLDLNLPTEAQWEFACRARTETPFSWGFSHDSLRDHENVMDLSFANPSSLSTDADWKDNYVYHAPVGTFAPNSFGLYDMHGNVTEWCADWYRIQYPADSNSAGTGICLDSTSQKRVFRGGGWYFPPEYCRSAFRQNDVAQSGNIQRGLRVARALVQ